MLIFNEIQKLKELNAELESKLQTLKEQTKSEVESSTRDNIQAQLESTLQEAKKQINAYADEKISQTNNDLEIYHTREVKRLFNAKIDELLINFSVDSLSKKTAQEFAIQNADNAKNALESVIKQHSSDFVRTAKSDIFNATQEALQSSREILDNARELQSELNTKQGLNIIKKYRFEASLHLAAIASQSKLAELVKAINEAKDLPNDTLKDFDEATSKTIHKTYATR